MEEREEYIRKNIQTENVQYWLNLAVEEMAELTTAIEHLQRGRRHNVEEEIADVENVLEYLKIIFAGAELEKQREIKLQRIKNLVENKTKRSVRVYARKCGKSNCLEK